MRRREGLHVCPCPCCPRANEHFKMIHLYVRKNVCFDYFIATIQERAISVLCMDSH